MYVCGKREKIRIKGGEEWRKRGGRTIIMLIVILIRTSKQKNRHRYMSKERKRIDIMQYSTWKKAFS